MGFPTANIEADAALDARDGVYASRVEVDGRMYDAMSNLGYKPTVDGRRRLLETNIFGFEGDLYGRRLRVELLRFIRPERRFGSVEELFRQIGDDRRLVFCALAFVISLILPRLKDQLNLSGSLEP